MSIPSRIRICLALSVAGLCLAPVANAQTSNANEVAYHTLLQQIADAKINIARQQVIIARQGDEIKGLNAQLDRVDDLKAAVVPMIEKMAAGIDREFKADYPFEFDARAFRIDKLKELVADETASVGDKYRKALNVYQIEVNYGQGMEAYKGNHPIPENRVNREGDDRFEKDGNGDLKLDKNNMQIEVFDGTFLRYGRTSFIYMGNSGGDAMRYDLAERKWVPLKGDLSAVRRAVRISKGEVAPGVVMAPVLPMP